MAKQTKTTSKKSATTSKAKTKKAGGGDLKDKDLDPIRGGILRRLR
jgi:hypothetical protein